MRSPVCLLLALAGALGAGPASAQEKHAEFTASVAPADPFAAPNQAGKKAEYQRGSVLLLTIRGKPAPGWHTYPIDKLAPGQDTGQRSKITLGKGFVAVGPEGQRKNATLVREDEPHAAQEDGKVIHEFD